LTEDDGLVVWVRRCLFGREPCQTTGAGSESRPTARSGSVSDMARSAGPCANCCFERRANRSACGSAGRRRNPRTRSAAPALKPEQRATPPSTQLDERHDRQNDERPGGDENQRIHAAPADPTRQRLHAAMKHWWLLSLIGCWYAVDVCARPQSTIDPAYFGPAIRARPTEPACMNRCMSISTSAVRRQAVTAMKRQFEASKTKPRASNAILTGDESQQPTNTVRAELVEAPS
jgi:hypothetical protein